MRRLFAMLALSCTITGAAVAPVVHAAEPVAFTLTNQDGQTVTERSFAGRYMLVFFGYTHCPDICPTTLNELAILADALPKDLRARLSFIFVTGDPLRDTPAVLNEYLSSFDGLITGLSGSVESVDSLAWALKAVVIRHGDGTGTYPVDHSTNFILLRNGMIIDQIPNTLSTEELVARLSRLMKG